MVASAPSAERVQYSRMWVTTRAMRSTASLIRANAFKLPVVSGSRERISSRPLILATTSVCTGSLVLAAAAGGLVTTITIWLVAGKPDLVWISLDRLKAYYLWPEFASTRK